MRIFSYFLMLLMVAGFGVADYFLVHSSGLISAVVRHELHSVFGDSLDVGTTRFDGRELVTLENVALRTREGGPVFLRAARVEIRIAGRRAEEVVLHDADVDITDEVREEWRTHPGAFLRPGETPEHLPLVRLPSARARIAVDGAVREATLEEAAFVPVTGEGYMIRARLHGEELGDWTVDGQAPPGRPVRLKLARADVDIADLRGAFRQFPEDLWNRLRPEGRASLEADVVVEEGSEPRVEWRADVRDFGFTFRSLRLQHLEGRIVSDGSIAAWLETARDAAGSDVGGRLSIRYRTEEMTDGAPWEMRFDMEDFPLVEVPRILPGKVMATWAQYDPQGQANFSGEASGRFGLTGYDVRVEVSYADARIRVPAFGVLTGLEGVAEYRGDTLQIWRMASRERDGQEGVYSISATVLGLRGASPRVRAEFGAEEVPFERLAEVAGDRFPIREHFAPAQGDRFGVDAGKVAMTWFLDETGAERQERMRIHLNDNRVVYRKFPVPLEGIRGDILIEGGRVEFTGVQARPEGILTPEGTTPTIRVEGYIDPSGRPMNSEFWIDARDLPIDERLQAYLPESIRSMTNLMQLQGRGQLTVSVGTRSGDPTRVSFVVGLNLAEASMRPGVDIADVTGSIFVDGVVADNRAHLTGHMRFPRATLADYPLSNFYCDFTLGDTLASFDHVRADVYGGTIQGDVQVRIADRTFAANLAAEGIDLAEYAVSRQRYSERGLSGELAVDLPEISGQIDDAGTFVGHGTMRISNGFVWGIPLFVRLLDLDVSRVLETGPREMLGNIEFDLRDRALHIPQMTLSDDTLTVYGRGHIGFDGQLHMILKTFPNYGISFPGLDLVKMLFNEVRGQVYAWEASGPFDDPQMSWKLFPSLTADGDDE